MADPLITGDVTTDAGIHRRAELLFAESQKRVYVATDKLFARLLVVQWVAAIVVATFVSPIVWHGSGHAFNTNILLSLVLGGVLTAFPVALTRWRPGQAVTRHVVAVAQIIYGSLFIHLTGGRIESHFHVFGSLAVLSFYRDWRVLLSASLVVAGDQEVRGLLMPMSIYGVPEVQPWRWLEHMCWVVFEDAFLVRSCLWQVAEMRAVAMNQAQIEETQARVEAQVQRRTAELQAEKRRFTEQYAEKEQLADIVATANDSIIAETTEGMIISWNKGAERCFGYTADDVMYQNVSILVPEDKKSELEEFIAAGRRGEILESLETTRLRKDGSVVPVLITRSPMFDAARQVIGISEMMHDITERKEAERRVSEFYSMVSHELRTPLTSIRGALGLIESGLVEPDESADLVQVARGSADRLIRLINDMLDLKKIESGKMELHRTKFEAEELVMQVIYAMRSVSSADGVTLLNETRHSDLVYADWDKSTQVLTNLISNGIKFSPQGQVKIVIDRGDYHRIRFSIIDDGPGIAPSDMHKLFGKFQQLDSSDSRQKGGTGLGLAICKALVERHGGAIGVDSIVGEGSTFWFELPMYIDKVRASGEFAAAPAAELLGNLSAAVQRRDKDEQIESVTGHSGSDDNKVEGESDECLSGQSG